MFNKIISDKKNNYNSNILTVKSKSGFHIKPIQDISMLVQKANKSGETVNVSLSKNNMNINCMNMFGLMTLCCGEGETLILEVNSNDIEKAEGIKNEIIDYFENGFYEKEEELSFTLQKDGIHMRTLVTINQLLTKNKNLTLTFINQQNKTEIVFNNSKSVPLLAELSSALSTFKQGDKFSIKIIGGDTYFLEVKENLKELFNFEESLNKPIISTGKFLVKGMASSTHSIYFVPKEININDSNIELNQEIFQKKASEIIATLTDNLKNEKNKNAKEKIDITIEVARGFFTETSQELWGEKNKDKWYTISKIIALMHNKIEALKDPQYSEFDYFFEEYQNIIFKFIQKFEIDDGYEELRNLVKNFKAEKKELILVIDKLHRTIADILDPSIIKGIVIKENVNENAHIAVFVRSSNIPCIYGININMEQKNLYHSLLDSSKGDEMFIINPTEEQIIAFNNLKAQFDKQSEEKLRILNKDSIFIDGNHFNLFVSILDSNQIESNSIVSGKKKVGLFRTEAQFEKTTSNPSRNEQVTAYQKVLSLDSNATIRLFDVASDKPLSFIKFDSSKHRGIGIIKANEPVYLEQIISLIIAGCKNALVPMIESKEDLAYMEYLKEEALKSFLKGETDRKAQLDFIRNAKDFTFSAMIETNIVLENLNEVLKGLKQDSDSFAHASVGGNDLGHYFFGEERFIGTQPNLYDYIPFTTNGFNPLKVLTNYVLSLKAKENNVKLSYCGEFNVTDKVSRELEGVNIKGLFAYLLYGLSFNSISMGADFEVINVKEYLLGQKISDFDERFSKALQAPEVLKLLEYANIQLEDIKNTDLLLEKLQAFFEKLRNNQIDTLKYQQLVKDAVNVFIKKMAITL